MKKKNKNPIIAKRLTEIDSAKVLKFFYFFSMYF